MYTYIVKEGKKTSISVLGKSAVINRHFKNQLLSGNITLK